MGFKKFKEIHKSSSHNTRTKNPAFAYGDKFTYENDGGRSLRANIDSKYIKSIQPLQMAQKLIANISSGARFTYYKMDSKGNKKPVTIKQFDDLKFNNLQSQTDFVKLLMATLPIYESTFIQATQATSSTRKGKIDFTILDGNKITIEPDVKETISHYKYKGADGTETLLDRDDIIYICSNVDVTNYLYALNSLTSLNYQITGYINANTFAINSTSNGGKSSFIVSSEDMLAGSEVENIQKAFKQFLNKSEPSAFYLDQKIKVDKISENMSSSQVLEQLTQINNAFLQSFNVPKHLLGDYSDMSNPELAKIASRFFFQTQILPYFKTIEDHFSHFIQNNLGLKGVYASMNYAGIHILEDSLKELTESYEKALKIGSISIDEFRVKALDMKPINKGSSNLHFQPAFLQGINPISVENYADDIARLNNSGVKQDVVPNGDGGSNNSPNENGAS